jgi:Gamma-glutamyl cyclotransferase, AIG2-like
VLERVLGRVPESRSATLDGYQRGSIRGERFPAIIAVPGEHVRGQLLLALDAVDLRALDAYEGDLYTRASVTVTLDDQRSVNAETYALAGHANPLFEPRDWSLEDFVAHDLDAFLRELG